MGDNTFVMVNGPSLFGANFGLEIRRFRFLASSQTFSPFVKGLKLLRERAFITCWANLWAARASLRVAEIVLRWDSTAGMEVSAMTEGRAWGSYPIMR